MTDNKGDAMRELRAARQRLERARPNPDGSESDEFNEANRAVIEAERKVRFGSMRGW